MNDLLDAKNNKIKVMYVRSSTQKNHKKKQLSRSVNDNVRNRRTDELYHHNDGYQGKSYPEKSGHYDSPWKKRPPASTQAQHVDHGGICGNSQIDAEQLRHQRAEETKVYGENACQALFHNRPQALIRAWFVQSITSRFRETLRWMAINHKAYHVVEAEELARVSGTEHHGGVCFLIKKRLGLDVKTYLEQAPQQDCVLALDTPGNPYNLGGIIRSGAHFGANAVLLQDPNLLESGAAVRTAEGGAEYIQAIHAKDLPSTLDLFRDQGYRIVTASSKQGMPLPGAELPARMVLMLGQEPHTPGSSTRQQGDLQISMGGTGRIAGLNISVAAGILLAQWWHQHQVKPAGLSRSK